MLCTDEYICDIFTGHVEIQHPLPLLASWNDSPFSILVYLVWIMCRVDLYLDNLQ